MTSIAARVDRLIALALDANTNENEARNAAMQACRLIQEHKLLAGAHASSPMDWIMETMFSHDTFRVQPPPPPPRSAVEDEPLPENAEPQNIPVLHPAWCLGCGQRIRHGAFATWSKGAVWHPPCYERAVR